ncbi:molybdopterin converting factor subunit 1 [Sneathiella chinensis]|uniref:Molybdopterin synthase sulfur carrier subunit n=1 Tax=Sneathiella chinensis TaxID=349750 RepID=A0ABQ5U250_9PROT|nr:molybdopterin converting factor subunit 1 [Sneathiella chinensis]GLQ06244.1 molybdopterin synthase sulfur carrier subunit [Sneathiella chinensis]
MKILYFAWLRSKLGISEEDVTLPGHVTTLYQLIDWLKSRNPAFEEIFQDLSVIRVAIDQEYVTEDIPLGNAREVAFFPPVTGG